MTDINYNIYSLSLSLSFSVCACLNVLSPTAVRADGRPFTRVPHRGSPVDMLTVRLNLAESVGENEEEETHYIIFTFRSIMRIYLLTYFLAYLLTAENSI